MVQEELNGVDGFTQTVMPCRLTGHANTTTWSFHVTHVPAFPTHQASDNHFATIARFLKDLAGIGCMDSIQREAVFGSIQSSSWHRVGAEIHFAVLKSRVPTAGEDLRPLSVERGTEQFSGYRSMP